MIIGFSTSKSILSRLIRWITKSKVSHTYLRLNIKGHDMVLHSNQHGVNFDQWEDFKANFEIVAEFELNIANEQESNAWNYAIAQLDKPYDFLAITGFLWVLLNKRIKRKVSNPFPNRSAYFCSELVIESLKAADFERANELDRELTSPEDLIKFLSSHDKAERL